MDKFFNWIKTNKTTLVGIFTAIYTIVMPILVNKGIVDFQTAGYISGGLLSAGFLAAKDNNKHSTVEQVTVATEKKEELKGDIPDTPVV